MTDILSRQEVEERLVRQEHSPDPAIWNELEYQALQTAKQLGEWLENAIKGEDVVAIWKARAYVERWPE